jgi:hypothetical protein
MGANTPDPHPLSQPRDPEQGKRVQEKLDEALADSFPASDPVSIVTSQAEEDWGAEPPVRERSAPG